MVAVSSAPRNRWSALAIQEMKKEFILRVTCHKLGCHEIGRFSYGDKKDYRDGYLRHNGSWMCIRHSDESKVLLPSNLQTTRKRELTVVSIASISGQHFWDSKNGFASGDCFRAWAKDFPVGTKLVMESTARIILPGDETGVTCKHCGRVIAEDTAGRGWRQGKTGIGPYRCCDTFAEPEKQEADTNEP